MSKEFKSPIGLPAGGEIQRCFYPFKIDTYGLGCQNNCLYCYAKSCLEFRGNWHPDSPAVADPKKIKKILIDGINGKGKYSKILQARVPVRLGSMTDCFQDPERKWRVTKKLIQILNDLNYPYLILTKNKLVAESPYKSLIRKDLAYVQFTITTPFEDVAKRLEPEASTPQERLDACKILSDAGIYTAVRINPLFPVYRGTDKYRIFDFKLVDMIAEAGAKTIIAGFVRLTSQNMKLMRAEMGGYWRGLFGSAKAKNQSYNFPESAKRYYYEKIRERCDELGMDFSICFDTDDAYDQFKDLWCNEHDCCNGKGNIKEFKTTYQDLNV